MKKIKTFLLLLVVTLSFCIGIDRINALPLCDFENNYGSVSTSHKPHVELGDTNYGMSRISYWCYDSTGSIYGAAGKGYCSNPSDKFYIQFNVSKRISDKDGYVESAKFTIYNNAGVAQCYIEPEITGEYGVYQFNFNLNKKEVSKIVAEGTYFDGDEVKSFGSDTFNINHAGDGSGSDHVDSGTSPTTLDDGVIGGADQGTGVASGTKTIANLGGNTQNACNSINDLFSEYWPYVMILVPVILIVTIVIDLFKALASSDGDALKKTGTNAVKRTVAAVIVLALPALLNYIFGLFGLEFCL